MALEWSGVRMPEDSNVPATTTTDSDVWLPGLMREVSRARSLAPYLCVGRGAREIGIASFSRPGPGGAHGGIEPGTPSLDTICTAKENLTIPTPSQT